MNTCIATYRAKDSFVAEIHTVKDIWGETCYCAKHPETHETLFGGMFFADIDGIKKAIEQ